MRNIQNSGIKNMGNVQIWPRLEFPGRIPSEVTRSYIRNVWERFYLFPFFPCFPSPLFPSIAAMFMLWLCFIIVIHTHRCHIGVCEMQLSSCPIGSRLFPVCFGCSNQKNVKTKQWGIMIIIIMLKIIFYQSANLCPSSPFRVK